MWQQADCLTSCLCPLNCLLVPRVCSRLSIVEQACLVSWPSVVRGDWTRVVLFYCVMCFCFFELYSVCVFFLYCFVKLDCVGWGIELYSISTRLQLPVERQLSHHSTSGLVCNVGRITCEIVHYHISNLQTFIVIPDRVGGLCFIICFIVCRITQKVVDGFSDEIFHQISTHSANLD